MTPHTAPVVDGILVGDCVMEMARLPSASVDLVFADPRPCLVERRPVDLLGRGLDADRNASGHRPVSIACMRPPVVTAPRDAEPTSAAYLPITPPA